MYFPIQYIILLSDKCHIESRTQKCYEFWYSEGWVSETESNLLLWARQLQLPLNSQTAPLLNKNLMGFSTYILVKIVKSGLVKFSSVPQNGKKAGKLWVIHASVLNDYIMLM